MLSQLNYLSRSHQAPLSVPSQPLRFQKTVFKNDEPDSFELSTKDATDVQTNGAGWFGRPKSRNAKFLKAVQGNNEVEADKQLRAGADINYQDQDEITGLMHSVVDGYHMMTDFLITKGADKDIQDDKQRTALIYLMMNPTSMTAKTRQDLAAKLATPVNMNIQDSDGKTALVHAVKNGLDSAAQEVIKAGADVTLADNDQMTALMYAAWNGQVDLINDILLSLPRAQRQPFIEAQDKQGRTALDIAKSHNKKDAIQLLQLYGA